MLKNKIKFPTFAYQTQEENNLSVMSKISKDGFLCTITVPVSKQAEENWLELVNLLAIDLIPENVFSELSVSRLDKKNTPNEPDHSYAIMFKCKDEKQRERFKRKCLPAVQEFNQKLLGVAGFVSELDNLLTFKLPN